MRRIALAGVAASAALAAMSTALPAAAQPYGYYSGRDPCQERQHNSGTAGALIGGAAGAALGNSVAHGGGRTGGTIIGGVTGAVIGNNIGRSSAKNSGDCQYQQNGYYAPLPPQGYYNNGYDGRYGYNGYDQQPYAAPPPPRSYYDDDDDD